MNFKERSFLSQNSKGFHRIVYSDWGDEGATPIICVHGLTGNGRDFDVLAESLAAEGRRLICVDLPGRGRSDFLPDPLDYNYSQYFKDLTALIAHLGINTPASVDWLGVSLGGLLGFYLAGLENTPIRRMIISDIAPTVPQAALDFIHKVIAQPYSFPTIQALEQRMRETRGLTWGPVTDEQWRHMAEHNARALEDGSITYAYDPGIAAVFEHQPIGAHDLWASWDNVTCPVLLLWGMKSVLLTKSLIDEMMTRGGGAHMDMIGFSDCGHVPSLMAPDQIAAIAGWLSKTDP